MATPADLALQQEVEYLREQNKLLLKIITNLQVVLDEYTNNERSRPISVPDKYD